MLRIRVLLLTSISVMTALASLASMPMVHVAVERLLRTAVALQPVPMDHPTNEGFVAVESAQTVPERRRPALMKRLMTLKLLSRQHSANSAYG